MAVDLQKIAGTAIDAYQENVRQFGGSEARHKVAREGAIDVAISSPEGRQFGFRETHHLADSAINMYRNRSRDLPHHKAREEAIKDTLTPPKDRGLDIKNYARSVVDSIRSNPGREHAVINAHSSIAQDEGRASEKNAYQVAALAANKYTALKQGGLDHNTARENVAKEIGAKFNERAQSTHLAVVKSRDAGLAR